MVRYLILLINALGLLLLSFFMYQDVELKMGVPEQVKAGEEFHVLLTLSKGSLESFSRYQQDLPYGLTAERISTTNADFSFENQRVRIIWLKLPKDDKLTISYKIKVDRRLKGSFNLSAEFSYIDGNERKNISFKTPHAISIIPDPSLTADQLIDIQDFHKQTLAQLEQKKVQQGFSIIRKVSEPTANGDITVELLINKGTLNKFAKIEEYIPNGYQAREIDSKNGIFSFEKNTLKILWMNLPNNEEFSVKYSLIADRTKKAEELHISGLFSYIDANQTKTIDIIEISPAIPDIVAEQAKEESEIIINDLKTEEIKETKATIKPEQEKKKEIAPTDKTAKTDKDEQFLLRAENGIYYRVQLAAGHAVIDIPKYFKNLAIKEEVKMEFHEGWRKYSVGSFKEYKEARDYRNLIWENTRINDAFVSAYNTGQRITVQEALMISNQKWYR